MLLHYEFIDRLAELERTHELCARRRHRYYVLCIKTHLQLLRDKAFAFTPKLPTILLIAANTQTLN
jgi:hypothetical protein